MLLLVFVETQALRDARLPSLDHCGALLSNRYRLAQGELVKIEAFPEAGRFGKLCRYRHDLLPVLEGADGHA